VRRPLACVCFAAALLATCAVSAQTPSPFPTWQNAAGIVLAPLGGPIPEWRVSLGGGFAVVPRYEGADKDKLVPAPAIDIRYRDIAFLSTGDGVGVNLVRGDTYRAGVAVGYDTGRDEHLAGRLNGLGNVGAAPEPRLFAEVALLPVVISANVRRAIGGHDGVIGDLGAYVPVIGNADLVVFVGPSLTFANRRYMDAYFGIDTAQALGSAAHLPFYQAHGGVKSAAFGASAIYHITEHWFVDGGIAWERLVDSAGNSPIVQDRDQLGLSVVMGYQF
jgi:outer membrane scaffolding protein for murein synthesis (MipA/OmpV family)